MDAARDENLHYHPVGRCQNNIINAELYNKLHYIHNSIGSYLRSAERQKDAVTIVNFASLSYKTKRFHVAMRHASVLK